MSSENPTRQPADKENERPTFHAVFKKYYDKWGADNPSEPATENPYGKYLTKDGPLMYMEDLCGKEREFCSLASEGKENERPSAAQKSLKFHNQVGKYAALLRETGALIHHDIGLEETYRREIARISSTDEVEILERLKDDPSFAAAALYAKDDKLKRAFGYSYEAFLRAHLRFRERHGPREKQTVDNTTIIDGDVPRETQRKRFIPPSLEDALERITPETEEGVLLGRLARLFYERESLPLYQEHFEKGDTFLAAEAAAAKPGVRKIIERTREEFAEYETQDFIGLNPAFIDPLTGARPERGMPALHQRIGICRLLRDRRHGMIYGCGTGKTALATAAQPLIVRKFCLEELCRLGTTLGVSEEMMGKASRALNDALRERYASPPEMCGSLDMLIKTALVNATGKEFDAVRDEQGMRGRVRTVILGPKTSIEAWQLALQGDDARRVLLHKQNLFTVNMDTKSDEDFEERLRDADWIFVNYEQLSRLCTDGSTVAEKLCEIGFKYLIEDEAHRIRQVNDHTRKNDENGNPRYTQSGAARLLSDHIIKYNGFLTPLTGTSMPDHPRDFAVIYHQLHPDKLPLPELFDELYTKNPRFLYTLISERCTRFRSEDVNRDLQSTQYDDRFAHLEALPLQRQLYDFIVQREGGNWLKDAMRVLTDPTQLDEPTLRAAGVYDALECGEDARYHHSAKFKWLIEHLTSSDGPLAKNEKVVISSAQFAEGITRPGRSYETLVELLDRELERRLGLKDVIAVVDGTVVDTESDQRRVETVRMFREDPAKRILLMTLKAGGVSLNASNANHFIALNRDHSPGENEQGEKRSIRWGQRKFVHVIYPHIDNSADDILDSRLRMKEAGIRIAEDGVEPNEFERRIINDREYALKTFKEGVQGQMGGTSIDVTDGLALMDVGGVVAKVPKRRGLSEGFFQVKYDPTQAQEIAGEIARNPDCWHDPEFVARYVSTLEQMSVPVMQTGKLLALMKLHLQGKMPWPKIILSEGCGPALLHTAYARLTDRLTANGLAMPVIHGRDVSKSMLDVYRKIVPDALLYHGDMDGTTLVDGRPQVAVGTYDMMDNESFSLLKKQQMESCVREAHRVLRDEGTLVFAVKNYMFKPGFGDVMKDLGFETVAKQTLAVAPDTIKKLKELKGGHYASSFASKLADTNILVAQKKNPSKTDVDCNDLWIQTIEYDDKLPESLRRIYSREEDEHPVRAGQRIKLTRTKKKISIPPGYWIDNQGLVHRVKE